VESEVPLRVGVTTPLSAWKEEGADAWSSAAGRQLVGGIEDRTVTRGSMRKFVAMQEMDGAILARLHHIQWCWQLRMGVQQEVIGGGRWWLGNDSLDARGPGAGPLPLSNSH
jgi:hypothetical protein